MSNKNIKLFCVTDKPLPKLENTNLILAGVGKYNFTSKYIDSSTKLNIFNKEEYYSELTFHYWYWKNLLNSEDGIAPGQACVFYSQDEFGDKILGGGWISKTENNYSHN